jgi:hypothetical protein
VRKVLVVIDDLCCRMRQEAEVSVLILTVLASPKTKTLCRAHIRRRNMVEFRLRLSLVELELDGWTIAYYSNTTPTTTRILIFNFVMGDGFVMVLLVVRVEENE